MIWWYDDGGLEVTLRFRKIFQLVIVKLNNSQLRITLNSTFKIIITKLYNFQLYHNIIWQ